MVKNVYICVTKPDFTTMTIQEISDLLDQKLDSKLEPIKNSIKAIETDMHAIKTHVDAINNRLYKLEERQIKIDGKLDSVLHATRSSVA